MVPVPPQKVLVVWLNGTKRGVHLGHLTEALSDLPAITTPQHVERERALHLRIGLDSWAKDLNFLSANSHASPLEPVTIACHVLDVVRASGVPVGKVINELTLTNS